ncbi:hypothetical protein [Glutamicibacter protophormiae]|uniref:hypothetical protein n=2 Tax=Glutamicibacter protophormiae TaxID=37930 RepID=UPI003BB0ECD6
MSAFRPFLLSLAALLALLGAVGGIVMFLQPWRSCPEVDDSSAGCPAASGDLALLGLAVAAMVVGLVLWLAALPRHPKITGELAAPFGALPASPASCAPPVDAAREPADEGK